jgi:hypothetical protein
MVRHFCVVGLLRQDNERYPLKCRWVGEVHRDTQPFTQHLQSYSFNQELVCSVRKPKRWQGRYFLLAAVLDGRPSFLYRESFAWR